MRTSSLMKSPTSHDESPARIVRKLLSVNCAVSGQEVNRVVARKLGILEVIANSVPVLRIKSGFKLKRFVGQDIGNNLEKDIDDSRDLG